MKIPALLLSFIFLPFIVLSQCPTGTCVPMAYEGFDYPNLSPLDDLPGGTGFADVWSVSQNEITVPGYNITTSGMPTYLDLQSSGGALAGGFSYNTVGRLLDTSADGTFQDYLLYDGIGAFDSTIYYAVVMRMDVNTDYMFTHLHGGYSPTYDNFPGAEIMGAGYYDSNSVAGGVDYWTFRVFDNYFLSSEPIVLGEDVLFVMSVTFDENFDNEYRFWINPPTIGATMPTPDIVQTVNGYMRFRSVKHYLGNGAGDTGAIDEMRIASSYQCAVPDAATPLNNSPVLNYTSSSLSGTAPLSVSFDASTSSDPDPSGSIVSYEWEFGDGTTATGMTATHTYTTLGNMTGLLTITDDCGFKSTALFDISVTDSNGNYPCLSTVRLNQKTSFNAANGEIEAFNAESYTLTFPDNSQVTQNTGVFDNLGAGNYTLEVTGAGDSCRDTFNLVMPTDSTTIPGWEPDLCSMRMGMNIDPLSYWNTDRLFKDYAKQAGYFVTFSAGNANTQLMDEIAVDENGYPLELPYMHTDGSGPHFVRSVYSNEIHLPVGDYVLLYDGNGAINANAPSITVTSQTPGRIEFSKIDESSGANLSIYESTLGNHVRNIRIVKVEHESNYLLEPFYEYFLDKLNPFEVIRFMEIQEINETDHVNWADRKPKDYYSQAFGHSTGISYEWIIDLGNLMQKDIWINVPHTATNDYITQMATLFRDNLNPNLNIYIELSNEVWNFSFPQRFWAEENTPSHWNYQRTYAVHSKNVFDIWYDVFQEDSTRVQRVLGTWLNSPETGEIAMSQIKEGFDYLSPTWYFGNACDNNLTDSSIPQDVLDCADASITDVVEDLRQHHMNAKLYGKEVITYEGGQHIVADNSPYSQVVWDAQVEPGMYDLYQRILDSLRVFDSKLTMPFTLASAKESPFGSWGALEYIEQDPIADPAPKYNALIDNIFCYDPPFAFTLPVELMELKANCDDDNHVNLTWLTASEENTSHFEVETLERGDWVKVGEVAAVGNSAEVQHYQFSHRGEGRYFRLKIIDFDDSYDLSEVLTMDCKNIDVKVYPNPTNGEVNINFSNIDPNENMKLEIFDILGKSIVQQKINNNNTTHTIDLKSLELATGTYFIRINDNDRIYGDYKVIFLDN